MLCWRFYGVWSLQSFLVLLNFFIQSFDKDRVFCCICIFFFKVLPRIRAFNRLLFRAFTRISFVVVFFPKFVWRVKLLEFSFSCICTFLLEAFKRKTKVFSGIFLFKAFMIWGKKVFFHGRQMFYKVWSFQSFLVHL